MSRAHSTGLLLVVVLAWTGARAEEDESPLAPMEQRLQKIGEQVKFVAAQYGNVADPSAIDQAKRHYSDAQTQYLLGDFSTAAALLFDVVEVKDFEKDPDYEDAVYFLADSLYKTADYLEARRYYRAILDKKIVKYTGEALIKLVEISGQLNDYTGIDTYFASLKGQAVTPEMEYVYAKWLARRTDVADADRITKGMTAFASIAKDSSFGPQATYFTGILQMEKGDLEGARKLFTELAADLKGKAKDAADPVSKIADTAILSSARILFEQGKYEDAVEVYQSIDRDSDAYVEALYETSSAYLKMGQFDKALESTEILLVLAEETEIAPEAKVLEGNLYLKLNRPDKAREAFESVVEQYSPIRDEIERLVTKRADPVRYFNDLIARGQKSLDITLLLPPSARRYVSGKDVASALNVVHELETSRKGTEASMQIAESLLAAVGEGKIDIFPTLQEGDARAVEADNALTDLEKDFVQMHTSVVFGKITPDAQGEQDQAREDRAALDSRFADLPKNQAQTQERKSKLLGSIGQLELDLFKMDFEVKSMESQLNGDEVYLSEEEAYGDADIIAKYREQVAEERGNVAELAGARKALLVRLSAERVISGAEASGSVADEDLRLAYRAALEREQAANSKVQSQLEGDDLATVQRIDVSMKTIGEQRGVVLGVRKALADKAAGRNAVFRHAVIAEQEQLRLMQDRVSKQEDDTRVLVGQVAIESFDRVGRRFHDFVLAGDVGLVDMAWARKAEKSDAIKTLALDKEKRVHDLKGDFKEVMQENE